MRATQTAVVASTSVRGIAQTVTSDVTDSVEAASCLLRLHPSVFLQFCFARITGSSLPNSPHDMLSCLVLSCLVLSCLVLSCLVLSCLVLSCLVLSCLVLSCLVLSCLVLSCLVLSCLVLSCLVLSCLVLSCLVLSCLVLSCLVLSSSVMKNGPFSMFFEKPALEQSSVNFSCSGSSVNFCSYSHNKFPCTSASV